MDRWSPYSNNFTQLSSGSPHLPPSVPPEDSLNNYGENNSNSLHMSSCQGLPLPTTNADLASTGGLNSNYENLIPQTIHSSKEAEFYDDSLYNGVCKENQAGGHNFLPAQGSANRPDGYPTENTPGYTGQLSSQPCQPNVFKRGSFGILPHESVAKNHAASRYERNNADKYGAQPPSVSYNNGPYADRDVSNIYSSAPLSAQSAFSGDTASLSPVVNSVTSPSLSNFSSPSDYYSSPKTSYGAYNSLQSPVPLSPSVAQSYPSSPFANVDPSNHISSAPPCSPMSGGIYMNNMNSVPQRNGQQTQHSPSNTSANMYTQNMGYGPQSVLQKTPPDYHSDYVYDHNSPSSYNAAYSSMHPGPMTGGNSSRISPRTHASHPNSMSYGHSNTMTPAPISSPTYMQNKVSHEAPFRGCSTSINSSQSMHPPRFPPSMNSLRHNNLHPNPSTSMADHIGNERNFNSSSDLVDDKSPIELFNYLDASGMHNHDPTSSDNPYMDNDPMLDGDTLAANRQLRSSEPIGLRQNCTVNMDNSNRTMIPCSPMLKGPQKEARSVGSLNYPYSSSSLDPVRPGNLSLNASGKRRGRRGRKRKADVNSGNIPRFQSFNDRNFFSNGYSIQPSNRLEYGNVDCYSSYKKRLCDEKEFPPVNYPFSRYRSELRMTENQKKNCSVVLSKPMRRHVSIVEELSHLGELQFPEENKKDSSHSFMKTRNKDSEGFLQCYRNFLASRKAKPASVKKLPEHAVQSKNGSKDSFSHIYESRKEIPKLILKLGESNISCKLRYDSDAPPHTPQSDHESASESSGDIPLSSHIKKENDIEEKTKRLKHSGKLNRVSERYSKHSANRKRTHSDKYNDLKDFGETNSETLPAGEVRIKPELESSPECDEDFSNPPKKRGRKSKASKNELKKKMRKSSHNTSDHSETTSFVPVQIKQEILDDDEIVYEGSRRSLRSRRSDTASSQEAVAGPSVKAEKIDLKDPIDVSSDDDIELLDDSDSDPAWTPSVKTPKSDTKSMQIGPKKRGPKPTRRSLGGSAGTSRQKREKSDSPRKRNVTQSSRKVATVTLQDPNAKCKREKERFLVAKVDIDKKTPFIWRVDKETNMLQRFEWYEQQGIILYRSTYTFAAWNEVSFSNYVTAKVRIVSHSRMIYVIEYLGPELTEATEIPALSTEAAAPTTTNPLRENFEVFLQTLISQALDPNFLSEITNENDEYFLNNIKEIENVSDDKKKILVKAFWEEDLLKSANTYPSLGIQDVPSAGECEVCKQDNGTKLLQFHGQPYDWITLGTIELLLPPKVQYNVCAPCSATISLYNRLQHHKYNFFIKCRSKMNDVKGTSDKMESHVLLEECLQDITWVNSLFEELEAMWKQCDEKS